MIGIEIDKTQGKFKICNSGLGLDHHSKKRIGNQYFFNLKKEYLITKDDDIKNIYFTITKMLGENNRVKMNIKEFDTEIERILNLVIFN